MPSVVAVPAFGARICVPAYYAAVSAIYRHMSGTSTLRQICFQLNAENYRTPSGLEWNRSRLANFIRNALVAV